MMEQEKRDEFQRVCESVLNYQKGLEEIDKYLGRLNGYMGQLGERLQEKQLDEVFCQYSAKIDSMTEGIAGIGARLQALQAGENGMSEQMKQMSRFSNAVMNFESAMRSFNQRVDNLSQKLYNKDFNTALKTMNNMVLEAGRATTNEYKRPTAHDFDILMDEYKKCSSREAGRMNSLQLLLKTIGEAMIHLRLNRAEQEAFNRLLEKMANSDSEALKKFVSQL
ncbi:MAG: hypothetical protein MSS66_09575 [Selenomonadaceae bacterium]|nr:hypothetical protein [Selenomonadaceae bacterium]